MSKKSSNYRCNCGKELDSKKEMIEHYRQNHPNDPFGLYDMLGTIGDSFADHAIQISRQHWHDVRDRTEKIEADLKDTKAAYEKVAFAYKQLANAGSAAINALMNANDAIDLAFDKSKSEL
jgi:hypothetical protein